MSKTEQAREGASELREFARDMENRLGDALDGLSALRVLAHSVDFDATINDRERYRSAIEWAVDRMKADLDAALCVAMEARNPA